MADLQTAQAKICFTAAGCLIHQDRVLLVKHKKLGVWLNPGGHLEANELPHRTAEREFWEETGIKVRATSPGWEDKTGEYLPVPFAVHLHWVSQKNYEARLAAEKDNAEATVPTDHNWQRGCEQHLSWLYLVEPVAGVDFKRNVEETDGIAWYGETEVHNLDTLDSIKQEVSQAFRLHR